MQVGTPVPTPVASAVIIQEHTQAPQVDMPYTASPNDVLTIQGITLFLVVIVLAFVIRLNLR